MRFKEIITALTEDRDLSAFVEDDANHEANSALVNTLRELQFSANHAQVPKISAEALINLVKAKPGGEAFNFEALMNAKKNDETVKNIIGDIRDDENGIKYVFITPAESDTEIENTADADAVKTAPEKTVSSMANRALSKRD